MNPAQAENQKLFIPFSSPDIQYAILFVLVIILILSIIFVVEEFSKDKENILFSLLAFHYSDIALTKLIILTKKIVIIALSVSLPFIFMYGLRVFKLLKPLFFTNELKVLILAYSMLFPLYIILLACIILEFSLIIVFGFLLQVSNKLKFFGNSAWLNSITAVVVGALAFQIWNSIRIPSNNYLIKVYGYPPISYISKAIIDITRVTPNISYSVKVLFLLIMVFAALFSGIVGLTYIMENKYLACIKNSPKKFIEKNLQITKLKGFSLLRNLPVFIRTDIYNFLRGGNTLKWLLGSFVFSITIPLLFLLPAMLNKKIPNLAYNIFGIKINYFAGLVLIISIVELGQLAIYTFYSEKNTIFLIKLSPVNIEKFLLEKFISTIIIALTILSFIIILVFVFFVRISQFYYVWIFAVQSFALFFWICVGNFYIGGSKITLSKFSFWETKNSSMDFYSTLWTIIISAALFLIYRSIFYLPHAFMIWISITELILPIFFFKKLLKRIKDAFEKLNFCGSG